MKKRKNIKAPTLPKDIKIPAIKRRKLNKVAFLLLFLAIINSAFHLYPKFKNPKQSKPNHNNKAIVIKNKAFIYPLPSTLAKNKAMNIDIGSEVIITKKSFGWYQIQTKNGKKWIESTSLLIEKSL